MEQRKTYALEPTSRESLVPRLPSGFSDQLREEVESLVCKVRCMTSHAGQPEVSCHVTGTSDLTDLPVMPLHRYVYKQEFKSPGPYREASKAMLCLLCIYIP